MSLIFEFFQIFTKNCEKNAWLIQTIVLNCRIKQAFRSFNMVISQDNKTNSNTNKGVRDRLLDSAEELFCEHGFEGASIRDIAAAAECNIASVNYYFGGKENLYIEVWRRHLITMRDIRIASIEKVMSKNDGEPRLEDLLWSYANSFIEPLVSEGKGGLFVKLMAREMIDRHLPPNMFLEEMVIPVMTTLQEALLKINPGLEESKARLAILSVVGQLIHTVGAETMFEQTDNPDIPKFELTEVVNHIVKFSAAGIRAYAEGKTE
jgi:AcrR family transcriptional regulator